MPEREEVSIEPLPRKGEVWKYAWLWAYIVKAGPKRVTFQHQTRTGWETMSIPTAQFLARFHKTGLGGTDA